MNSARRSGQIGAIGYYWTVIGAIRGGVCLGHGARVRRIYRWMTREEFIEVLEEKGYPYNIEDNKILITYQGDVDLGKLVSLPSGVDFRNLFDVYLDSIESFPLGVEFNNGGNVELRSLVGGWIEDWKGNIEGVDSNRLLNLMISKGLFER